MGNGYVAAPCIFLLLQISQMLDISVKKNNIYIYIMQFDRRVKIWRDDCMSASVVIFIVCTDSLTHSHTSQGVET